jgi:hypothetical protein
MAETTMTSDITTEGDESALRRVRHHRRQSATCCTPSAQLGFGQPGDRSLTSTTAVGSAARLCTQSADRPLPESRSRCRRSDGG